MAGAPLMADIRSETPPRSRSLVALMTFGGLVVGVSAGWAIGTLIKRAGLQPPPWSDVAALAMALFFFGLGLTMIVFSTHRRGLALLANPRAPEFNRSVGGAEKLQLRLQAAVTLLAGVLLAAPVAFGLLARKTTTGMIWMGALAGLFALQSFLNLALWRRSDEVFRRSIADTGAVCFWALQGALFLWGSGEKLRVLPAMSSWDAVQVMMGVYLLASTMVAYRRGLG